MARVGDARRAGHLRLRRSSRNPADGRRAQGSPGRTVGAGRRQLEADLLAMQARVEPQFLFDAGPHRGDLRTDAASAECLLDSLITFLRAAMPQVRETTSTLEQEIALAFAYVSIQSIRSGHSAHCEADVPDELRAARVPPMTIIPLLDQAVNLQSASGSSRGAVRIVAASGAARLQVSIHVANCCLATEKAPTTMACCAKGCPRFTTPLPKPR